MAGDISVVIPTRGRPQLVTRSVKSALDQSLAPVEVVVVIDGPDPETVSALADISDARLKVIQLEQSLGGGGTRNAGIRAATGDLVALLDDDDEWTPSRLEHHVGFISKELGGLDKPFFSASGVRSRGLNEEHLWPLRGPEPGEPIGEFLFKSYGLRNRHHPQLATSTFILPRAVLLANLFDEGLKQHQDWDLLLRMEAAGIPFVFAPFNDVYLELGTNRRSISRNTRWETSLKWVESRRNILTPRAYSGFCASIITGLADGSAKGKAQAALATLKCRPSPADLSRLAVMILPSRVRNAVGGH